MSENECPNTAVVDTLHFAVLGLGMREQYCPGFDQAYFLMPILILFISGLSDICLCSSIIIIYTEL